MKKFFILSAFCLLYLQAKAKDYVPFVEDGKVWNMELVSTWQSWPDYGIVRNETWELKGDTVIKGTSYIKYYEEGGLRGAMREEDKKVYFLNVNNNQETLLYDFNLTEGGRINNYETEYVLTAEDHVKSGEYVFRRMKIVDVNDSRNTNYWIEGIGALEGPCNPFYSMRTGGVDISIASCYVGGQCIYDKGLVDGIERPSAIENGTTAIYDLQGHKLTKRPDKGLYIENGKLKTR